LVQAGFSYWQVCPLGATGYGNSPYQSFSAFAGNPYLIDLEALVSAGLVQRTELATLDALPQDRVDFGAIWLHKWPVLFAAAERFRKKPVALPYGDFQEFCAAQTGWLSDYAFFLALKDHFDGRPWWEWPTELRNFEKASKSPLRRTLSTRIFAHQFLQYLFFGQWRQIRARAAELGIRIVGDVPIFVALDSADVWSNPGLFLLDQTTRRPTFVAGVPPDYFSADGQLWGNPLYDWPEHQRTGYFWWLRRLAATFDLCDVVRIDHFRGFESYWAVPAGAPNARKGSWELGPGLDFFRAVQTAFPNAKIIAEDLGVLTPEVLALREATGLPGMAITQFAFGGDAKNLYLPHNHVPNCVLYPGTHDNDTTRALVRIDRREDARPPASLLPYQRLRDRLGFHPRRLRLTLPSRRPAAPRSPQLGQLRALQSARQTGWQLGVALPRRPARCSCAQQCSLPPGARRTLRPPAGAKTDSWCAFSCAVIVRFIGSLAL
jgi:4-alpha-glucanotransferase